MKKRLVWAIAIMGLVMALPAYAAQAPKEAAPKEAIVKLDVIDTTKILRESKAAKNAQVTFQKDLEAKRGILAAGEKEVRLLDEELKNPARNYPCPVRAQRKMKITRS